ncbi:hypothetical protein OY671_002549 [Metschnikowia pulcherrima]|nr:hypothetical protein OY671_002549 [Metschnikowia pulcherrima]
MAPQWATSWTARETGEEGSSGSVTSWRHRPAAVDKADDMPLGEGSDGRRGISVISDPLRGDSRNPGRGSERDRCGSSELDAGRGRPSGARDTEGHRGPAGMCGRPPYGGPAVGSGNPGAQGRRERPASSGTEPHGEGREPR